MTYLKDQLNGTVRAFNEEVPKDARKLKVFMKAKMYDFDGDENSVHASSGRWRKCSKTEYTKYVKSTKAVDVESTEVE